MNLPFDLVAKRKALRDAVASNKILEAKAVVAEAGELADALWKNEGLEQKRTLLVFCLSIVPQREPNAMLHWVLTELRADPNEKSPIGDSWARHPFEFCFDGLRFAEPAVAAERVQMLVAAGCNVNAEFNCRFSPLTHAIRCVEDNGPLIQTLLAAGARTDVLIENYNWNTSLFKGTKGNLILHKASALHLAAACHAIDTVCLLLDAGADATLKDQAGRTPANVATLRSGADVALVHLLESPPPRGAAKAFYLHMTASARAACSSASPDAAAAEQVRLQTVQELQKKLSEALEIAQKL